MAEIEGLDLVIKTNVTQATQGLQSVQKGLAETAISAGKTSDSLENIGAVLIPLQNNLRAFEAALKKATDPGEVQYLQKSIGLLKDKIAALDSQRPLTPLAKGADQATFALTNLGRVVQDAPFGFIGIQNNIQPLFESFTRLKQETGSTSLAFKALVGSLTGVGGVGLAISVVTSLLTVFSGSLFKTSKETSETKKATDEYAESAAKEILKLNELIAVAKDESISRNVRLAAVQKLKAEYPNYLKGLTDEQILAGQLGTAYDQINKALLAKVALQAAEDKIIPLLKQQVELQLQLQKVNQTLDLQRREGTAQGFKSANTISKLLIDDNKTLTERNRLTREQAGLQAKINAIQKEFSGLIKISAPLDFVFKPETKKAEDNLLKAANRFDFTKAYIELAKNSREALKQVNLLDLKDFETGLKGALKSIVPPPLPLIDEGDAANKKPKNNRFKALQDDINATADLLKTVLTPAFDAAFNAIENGQNAFKAVGEAIKKVVFDLIKAAVEAAIFSVIINAVTGGGGSLLKGFGGVFGQLSGLGSLFPHATGGIITKPLVAGQHLFGEAGKEAVIPLDRLNEFINPANNFPEYLPALQLRGETLRVLYQRANNSFLKNR